MKKNSYHSIFILRLIIRCASWSRKYDECGKSFITVLAKQTQLHAEKSHGAGIEMTRIVTRLDGARCKKPDWRLHARPEAFREQICCEEKVLVTLLGLFGTPAVIRHSHNDLAPGILRPLTPLITPQEVTQILHEET